VFVDGDAHDVTARRAGCRNGVAALRVFVDVTAAAHRVVIVGLVDVADLVGRHVDRIGDAGAIRGRQVSRRVVLGDVRVGVIGNVEVGALSTQLPSGPLTPLLIVPRFAQVRYFRSSTAPVPKSET